MPGKIVQSDVSSNCEIAVLNFNGEALPIIFATEQVQENEVLCLSLTNIQKFNMEFLSLDQTSSKHGDQKINKDFE